MAQWTDVKRFSKLYIRKKLSEDVGRRRKSSETAKKRQKRQISEEVQRIDGWVAVIATFVGDFVSKIGQAIPFIGWVPLSIPLQGKCLCPS